MGDNDGALGGARARTRGEAKGCRERRDADHACGHHADSSCVIRDRSTRRVARTGAERRCEDDAEGGSDGRFQRTSQRGACDGRVACAGRPCAGAVEYERRGHWAEPSLLTSGESRPRLSTQNKIALRAFVSGMLVSLIFSRCHGNSPDQCSTHRFGFTASIPSRAAHAGGRRGIDDSRGFFSTKRSRLPEESVCQRGAGVTNVTHYSYLGDESGAAMSRSSSDTFFEGQRLGRSETGASWLGTRVGPLTAASA